MMPTICARCAKLEERIKELERENGKLAAFKEGAMAAAALARPPHVTINNPASSLSSDLPARTDLNPAKFSTWKGGF